MDKDNTYFSERTREYIWGINPEAITELERLFGKIDQHGLRSGDKAMLEALIQVNTSYARHQSKTHGEDSIECGSFEEVLKKIKRIQGK